MPKISIIIPVCNTAKYLKQCLISLLNQTLKDFEVIFAKSEDDFIVKTLDEILPFSFSEEDMK